MARGHPPPHCENTQVLREAITEDDDDDDRLNVQIHIILIYCYCLHCITFAFHINMCMHLV